MDKSAQLSECGQYRYRLGRRWSSEGMVLWIMLNPSTADASVDDRTIGRCIGFAQSWGYGAITVGNIFPYRATKPKDLRNVDRWGIGNGRHLLDMAREADLIVAAWGSSKFVTPTELGNLFGKFGCIHKRPIKCLGKTHSGAPLHPLYQPSDAVLIDYLPTNS